VPKVWSIVVAGGSGSRFGEPKQFVELGGRPVLEWAVDACRPGSTGVILVVPDADAAGRIGTHGADEVVAGGATRDASVRRALDSVPADAQIIVVHDAARPLATPALFGAVVEALADPLVDGAVPGSSPGDTIKVVDADGAVTATLDRATLRAVQTPQAFRAGILRRAHRRGVPGATDDAMMVEALGGRVRVLPGEADNLKITVPGDLQAAARILAARAR
jgi:2-C-methyl-D-erythritol 4-phosphate cytidylyltransferase